MSLWHERAVMSSATPRNWSPPVILTHLIVLTLPHLEVGLSEAASNSVLIRERREYLLLDRSGYRGGSQGTYQHNLRELSSFNQMAPWQSYQLYRFSKPKRKWSGGYLDDHWNSWMEARLVIDWFSVGIYLNIYKTWAGRDWLSGRLRKSMQNK